MKQYKYRRNSMELNDSIINIKGIGEKSEKLFNKLGISTVGELLCYYPREYEIFRQIEPISGVAEGRTVIVEGSIVSKPRASRHGNLKIIECDIKDSTGLLRVVWFNMPFLMKTLHMGTKYILRGTVVNKNGILRLQQPKIISMKEYANSINKLFPIYSLTAGMTNNTILKAVKNGLDNTDFEKDILPAAIRKKYDLVMWKKAIQSIHFPKDKEECIKARKRLVFDEFFSFFTMMNRLKKEVFEISDMYIIEEIKAVLSYTLTEGQDAAVSDIINDMESGYVMNRLIQGDVGSGKTIVAVIALALVVKNGYQGAIMVPTEVLAKQHYQSFCEVLGEFGIRIGMLIGSMTAAQKKKEYKKIEDGEIDIVVGTHALIQEKVSFKDLALVVTDEQHRFGVRQREALSSKGREPHMLVMSATPIPRTLAIILYGDLDVSVINVMPKGRLPIKNCVVGTNYRPQAYRFMEKEIAAGHQVYIICPMVEESENMEAENVTDYTNMLETTLAPSIRIKALYGKMKASLKNEIMEQFAAHEIDILVSTTVIEVGINVPNATIMMIENAERFGLAQLHQLRGRVGRGDSQSYCIFMAGNPSKDTMKRLRVLEDSNDGFFVAKQDLKLRGPGDFFGIRQSGELDFALADIYQDADIMKMANEAAKECEISLKDCNYGKKIVI
jgi:ATP-dependent DNA helicase RecG